MGYAAEIFEIFYSQWDYQMVNISRILNFLTWHGFDEFGWSDPEEFTNKFCSAVVVALSEPELENDDCDSFLSLVKDIREKLKICNKQEMVQLFTSVPDNWSIKNTTSLPRIKTSTWKV